MKLKKFTAIIIMYVHILIWQIKNDWVILVIWDGMTSD